MVLVPHPYDVLPPPPPLPQVMQVCLAINPRLVVRRARFSALTSQQLNRTINK